MGMQKENIAELCGIHAGDGYLRNDGKRIEWDVSGSVEEKEYYDEHVIPILNKTFDLDVNGRFFPCRNTYGFVVRDKEVVKKIHSLGFPYGNKTLTVKIPNFILNSNKRIKAFFLRGVFDTDGCLTFDRKGKIYKENYHIFPRVFFSTVSKYLFLDIQKLLKDLSISYSIQIYEPKRKNESTRFRVWLLGSNALDYIDKVGSKNNIKLSRYSVWLKYGICPPNTSYKQRIEMMKGTLNPKVFYGPVA
jgi:intein/homing endonuclease